MSKFITKTRKEEITKSLNNKNLLAFVISKFLEFRDKKVEV